MVLVDRAGVVAAARVREVASDRALEEALAALARHHSVVLPGALVAAYNALEAAASAAAAVAVQSCRFYVHHRTDAVGRAASERRRTAAIVVVVVGSGGSSIIGRASSSVYARRGRTRDPAPRAARVLRGPRGSGQLRRRPSGTGGASDTAGN